MRRLALFLLLAALPFSASVEAGHRHTPVPRGHFFLPSRTLFFFQPSLYLHAQAYARPVVISPVIYSSPHHRSVGYAYSDPRPLPRVFPILLNSNVRGEIVQANTGAMILRVTPPRALVYVDGKLIGSGGDFASHRDRYPLMSGVHEMRIELPGFLPFVSDMEVAPNRTLNLEIELQPEP